MVQKNKTKLIEMIVYGCITNKLNEEEIEDISINHVKQILNKKWKINKIITSISKFWIKEKRY